MKNTFFIAAALFVATATFSFAANNVETAKNDQALDCWSDTNFDRPADIDQQSECPNQLGECCYKPANNPVGYESFSEN